MHLCFVYLTLKIFCNYIEKNNHEIYLLHVSHPDQGVLDTRQHRLLSTAWKKSAIKAITLTHTNYLLLFVNKWLIFTLRHADIRYTLYNI